MEKRANAAVIIPNGISMDWWIFVSESKFIDAGWCKVDHHSTENFIIGTLITPINAIKEETLFAVLWFSNILHETMYIR